MRLADGTCVSKPGSAGTDWRVHGVFDLGRGGFSHLELTDRHGAEALERGAPQPGKIRIGDRNYARAPVLRRFRAQSGDTADFIVRLGWNALQLTNPAGRPFVLVDYLQCLPPDRNPHEVNLRASVGRDEPALAVRLIVQRKTPEAAEATRVALRRSAARKGKTLDPRSLIAADFMILATSLPKSGYSGKAVLAAYRLRWQIELAFKRLKSLLHIVDGAQVIACHYRSYDRGEQIEQTEHLQALIDQKQAARQHRATDRLAQMAPASRDLLVRAAERGANLGAITHGLMRLLDRYGAADLQAAIREALERDVPHPNAVRLALERRREQRGQAPPVDIELPADVQARDAPVQPHALETYDELKDLDDE